MKNKRKKASMNIRILLCVGILALCFSILIGRTAYLQFIRGGELRQLALEQQTKENEITPRRGTIFDSNGVTVDEAGFLVYNIKNMFV